MRYEIAVVSRTKHLGPAWSFVADVLGPHGPARAARARASGCRSREPALRAGARRGDGRSALSFLLLPIVAIFLRIPLGHLLDGMRSDAAVDALVVTLKTNAIANVLILLFGTPAAYLIASRRFRGRALAITLVELPLVLPPAVAGIGLLAAFGRFGLLGDELDALGIEVGFTQLAVVLAVTFVASPFYLRAAIAAFEAVDADLLAARPHARRRPGSDLLPRRAAARGRRARRRLGARLRPRPRRVRRHDHVRRLASGRDADALPRRLRAVRRRLRHRARDRRRARGRQRRCPPRRQAGARMETLELRLDHALRSHASS